jgi:two-component system sensor histidine kinase RegB
VQVTVVADVALLTALLGLNGGASNPFTALYLVHVALAAVMLGARWTWWIAGLSAAGYGALFPITDAHFMHAAGQDHMNAHLLGMWAALVVAGAGISYFVADLAAQVRAREAELGRLKDAAQRRAKLDALATLAAGAAHELGTPLGVIAVAAREIELGLEAGDPAESLLPEAQALSRAAGRCREILSRMAGAAGAPSGAAIEAVAWQSLAADLRNRLEATEQPRVEVTGAVERVRAPRMALVDALHALVRNGLLAGATRVEVDATVERDQCRITVHDDGAGMPAQVLERAGEPFFSTRAEGQGTGLGLYLTRSLVELLGGQMNIESTPGAGTRVVLHLPTGEGA